MKLSDVFRRVSHKRLAAVDIPGYGSNQHEIGKVLELKEYFLSLPEPRQPIRWLYFSDSESPLAVAGDVPFMILGVKIQREVPSGAFTIRTISLPMPFPVTC